MKHYTYHMNIISYLYQIGGFVNTYKTSSQAILKFITNFYFYFFEFISCPCKIISKRIAAVPIKRIVAGVNAKSKIATHSMTSKNVIIRSIFLSAALIPVNAMTLITARKSTKLRAKAELSAKRRPFPGSPAASLLQGNMKT